MHRRGRPPAVDHGVGEAEGHDLAAQAVGVDAGRVALAQERGEIAREPALHLRIVGDAAFEQVLLQGELGVAEQNGQLRPRQALAARLAMLGYRIVSGGTDNHLMLIDLRPHGLTGVEAQTALDHAAITVNKNAIPFDTEPITKTGGIRVGTPAMTTRGLKEEEMMEIAELMHAALEDRNDQTKVAAVRREVIRLTSRLPLP